MSSESRPRPQRLSRAAKRSFPPVVDARARVLVLGTLPGEESLRRGEYYAHPRNLFWPIIFALVRRACRRWIMPSGWLCLTAQRIALWDVCELGERGGQRRHDDPPGTAECDRPAARPASADPRRRVQRQRRAAPIRPPFRAPPGLTYLALPSTSPAHATIGFAAKLARWTALREVVELHGAL